MLEMDEFDGRILEGLQHDGRMAIVELAERVHLSPTACHKRVKRLEDAGIITGYSATVAPRALGYQLEAFIAVTIERQEKSVVDLFKKAVAKLSGVRACYLLAGDIDFLLQVVTPDLDSYTKLVMNDIMALPGTKAVRTWFVLDRLAAIGALTPEPRKG